MHTTVATGYSTRLPPPLPVCAADATPRGLDQMCTSFVLLLAEALLQPLGTGGLQSR